MITQNRYLTHPECLTHPKRMDVWYARIDRTAGSYVQGGNRPVLIVSNDINNAVSPVVTVIPITSKAKKPNQPTHVWLDSVSVVGDTDCKTVGDTDCDTVGGTDVCGDMNTDCGEGSTDCEVEKQNCGEGITTYPVTEHTTYPVTIPTTYPMTEQTTYPTPPPTTPPPTAEARGMILAEQITTIDKDRLLYLIGRLEDDELVSQVERAIDVQLGLIEPWKSVERSAEKR